MGKNRGEWSEVYVVLSLLDNPNLNIVDNKLEDLCKDLFIVEKLSIKEKQKLIDFIITSENEVKIYFQNQLKNTMNINEIESNIEIVKNNIKNAKKGHGAFEIEELKPLLAKMTGQDFLKSDSNTKSDLTATVLDTKISDRVILKYSIKSSLGSPATILNASKTTNFIYEVEGLNKEQINIINKITTNKDKTKSRTKLRDGLKQLYEFGGKVKYVDTESDSFKYNLEMIDSNMPMYLGKVLLNFYNNVSGSLKGLFLSTNDFKDEDFAVKKLSDFLKGISFGFFPNKKWNGINEVNGGLIIVKSDGNVVVLDLVYFEQEVIKYLINETKLDTPSSTRYKMVQLYEKDGRIFFKLNLQIRYKK